MVNRYTFGSQQIYNPWSIISCLQNNGVFEAYWRNTSDNSLIFKMIQDAPASLRQSLGDLISGIPQTQTLSDNIAFQYLEHNSQAIWTLLLHTGYLNAIERGFDPHQNPTVTLQIPNREVMTLFHSMIYGFGCPSLTIALIPLF